MCMILIGSGLILYGYGNGGSDYLDVRVKKIGVLSFLDFNVKDSKMTGNDYTSSNKPTSVKLDISVGNIEIKSGSNFSVHTKGILSTDVAITDGGNSYEFDTSDNSFVVGDTSTKAKVIVTIPPYVSNLDISTEVGNITATDISIPSVNLETDVGEIAMLKNNSDTVKLASDLGNINYSGDVKSSLNVSADAGAISTRLTSDSTKYDYYLKSDVGTIKVDDKDSGNNVNIDNNSKINIKLTTDTGAISLKFNSI